MSQAIFVLGVACRVYLHESASSVDLRPIGQLTSVRMYLQCAMEGRDSVNSQELGTWDRLLRLDYSPGNNPAAFESYAAGPG